MVEVTQLLREKVSKGEGPNGPFLNMRKEQYSFPTIGDLVKELFNASGLLARKNTEGRVINESEKKTIQMKLKRLSDETSKLDDQLDDLITVFSELLYDATRDERVVFAVVASLQDALAQYKDLIREEGTYLSYSDSVKWLVYSRGLERLVISISKNQLAYNVSQSNLTFPLDSNWWLPKFSENEVIWPIKKVWQWIYSEIGMSQRQFHLASEKYSQKQERHLENAQRWTSDRQLPSTYAMLECLEDSLSTLKSERGIDISSNLENSFRIALVFARFSTHAFKMIKKHFGKHFAKSIQKALLVQCNRLRIESSDILELCDKINEPAEYIPNTVIDNLVFDTVTQYWHKKSGKIIHYSKINQKEIIKLSSVGVLPPRDSIRRIRKAVGGFMLSSVLRQYKIDFKFMPKPEYANLLLKGLGVKKDSSSLGIIQAYEKEVISENLTPHLGWLVNWSYANYFYRQEDYSLAYDYYKKSFERAKYSAGKNQYLLVNQYIEICAKNKKYREFKKGISWASYLGVDVRWLRNFDDPESEESISFLYDFMNIARYSHL